MTYIKSFFGRITKDFAQHQLLPLKILFFVHSSTIAVLYPYLTIHMRELGINVEETAIMSSLIPIVAIIMPPLAGMIADKIGNFKLLLALSSVTGGSAALLLLLVPVGRISVIFPPRVEMTIGCPAEDISMLKMDANQFSCHPAHPYAYNVEMRLETCGFVCDWDEESGKNGSFPLDEAVSYAVNVQNSVEEAEVFRYPLGSRDRPMSMDTIYKTMARNLTNNVRYKTALRRLSKTSLFFPTEGMYDFDCRFSTENSTDVYCEFGSNETSEEKLISSKTSLIPFVTNLTPIKKKSGEYVISLSNKPNMNMLKQFDINSFAHKKSNKAEDYGDFSKATCNDNFAGDNEGVFVEIIFQQQGDKAVADPVGTTVVLDECRPKCLLTAPRHQLCSNAKEATDLDSKLTFWSYLAVRVFIGIIGGTAFAMFEGAVIAILREHKADYGLQRIYGILGSMIASPLSGYLIDYCSRGKGYTDFRPAFYLYAVLKIVGGILMLTINLEFKAPASDLLKDVVKVLKNVEIVALFVAVFVLGTAWGYIESFLFWLLQDLGANSSLMGITITVGGFAGIPLLVLSGPIIDRIGHANVLFIGFIFYAIRLMGYSLIYNPWMCLLFEALEGVTTSLAFTAAVTYTARLSTTTTDTSIQGFMGGLYYGVGKGSGSLIGGYLMKAFGTRPTYQIFAGASLITGCVYFLFNKLYLRKLPQKEMNDICKKAPKVADVESCEKNGTQKSKSEKKPLKDYKGNINLYSENDQHRNSKDGSMLNYQSSEKFENGKSKGIDNPVFETNESGDGCKKQRSGSATDTKGSDYYK